MRARKPVALLLAALAFSILVAFPLAAQRVTDEAALRQMAETLEQRWNERRTPLYYQLLRSTDPAQMALNRDPGIQLMYIRENGIPLFYNIDNINAARTVSTYEVWPGGGSGHNLTGLGTSSSQLGIWDGGGVRVTHQEFGGRVSQIDSPGSYVDHATHVAGTMVAAGVSPNAKGMSYQANLSAYDWSNDESEMASAAAAGLRVSNHSYGVTTGWYYNSGSSTWYWYGDVSISTVEDWGFGFYSSSAQQLDDIAYDAPNYLIVKSAGNDRDDDGPGPGGSHLYWNGGWVWSTTTRDPDGGADGYDCVGWAKTAKNILTVGAVNDIGAGYGQPGDVVQTVFSSWGPTDDGRVKPDIVANGAALYSCISTGNTAYASYSGTSMSAPNASGSINLLYGHYVNKLGSTPRSATIKGIVIHTADEAGVNDGPDYQNGWGLLNTEEAANLIAADTLAPQHIIEDNLSSTSEDHFFTVASLMDIRVTLSWTDLPGTPPSASLNPTTPMLVNDLDLRVEHVPTATTYYPWRLNGASPAAAATKGDNSVDNVEVADITCAPAGQYRATVSHKGSLSTGSQDYTLVWSERFSYNPQCVIEPTSIDFGTIDVGDSADATFTIINTGCNALAGTVSEICSAYYIASGAVYSIAPGDSHDVTVRFRPTSSGTHNCTIETGSSLCSDVSCTGESYIPASCQVEPDTLDFGTVNVGSYALLTFDITNNGSGIIEGTVTESCDHYFVFSGATYYLGPAQSNTVTIMFAPASAGTHTCLIETGDALCTDVFCTGVGGSAATCLVDPDSLVLGLVQLGEYKDSTFIVTNTGGGLLTGTVSEVCGGYSVFSGGGPYSLAAGESLLVGVRFEPAWVGQATCTIETGSGLCGDVWCGGAGIDTIPPPPPEGFSVAYNTGSGNLLTWRKSGAGDFEAFKIYRSENPDLVVYTVVDSTWQEVHSLPDTSWTDVVADGWRYRYQITALDSLLNESDPSPPETVTGTRGDVSPVRFTLYQNVPNPFNPTTSISFDVPPGGGKVTLRVYDVGGRLVRTLVDDVEPAGHRSVIWNGRDNRGQNVATGVYFYRMTAPGFEQTRKMILMK